MPLIIFTPYQQPYVPLQNKLVFSANTTTWVVPSNVAVIKIKSWGAAGGGDALNGFPGGGGWFGGHGGGDGATGGGGGGGSGHIIAGASSVINTTANGSVVANSVDIDYLAGRGNGTNNTGQPGLVVIYY